MSLFPPRWNVRRFYHVRDANETVSPLKCNWVGMGQGTRTFPDAESSKLEAHKKTGRPFPTALL